MKSVVDPENVYCFIVGGSDYTRVSQRRTLQSGSIECVSIPIIDDTVQELTEVFLVTLSTSSAVRLENNSARVEIVDDDDGEKVNVTGYSIMHVRGVFSG